MTPRRLGLVLLTLALAAAPADADGPPRSSVTPPVLAPGGGDLLPFDELERGEFMRKHAVLLTRTRALESQQERLAKQLAKLDARKQKDERAQVEAEIRRLRVQSVALRLRVTEALVAEGVDPALIAWINAAPKGPGREERYAYGLVRLLPGLDAPRRALFDRVVPQMSAARDVVEAQKERTLFALKQTELTPEELRGVSATFDRQLQVVDQRFWMLVDLTLDRDAKVALWKRLPGKLKRKSQPVEHLYQLPDLTPSQGARLKAVLAEMEQEASPDQAAVKSLGTRLREKGLSAADRAALERERGEAYARLADLQRATAAATRGVLTEEQYLDYLAIPPRLSTNERRASYQRVLEGFEPTLEQKRRLQELQKEGRETQRALQARIAEIRRAGAAYGPDSPQTMGMQMAMAGAQAEGAAAGRDLLGRFFLEVLTPDEVTRWLMGHWGYKR